MERALWQRGQTAGNEDTALLKVLALAFMLIDHLGAALYPRVGELRIIGRMAFPLYAWCLVVGSEKTRDIGKYALRLLLLALISQPLYMMALNHKWTDFSILFMLLIALAAIRGIQLHRYGSQFWVPALCYLLLGFINVDYGWRGLTFILILYLSRNSRQGIVAAFLAYALFWGSSSSSVTTIFGISLVPLLNIPGIGTVLSAFFRLQGMVWLALPLIVIPMKSGLRLPKWLGYSLYPLHLLLLVVLKLFSGISVQFILKNFLF